MISLQYLSRIFKAAVDLKNFTRECWKNQGFGVWSCYKNGTAPKLLVSMSVAPELSFFVTPASVHFHTLMF